MNLKTNLANRGNYGGSRQINKIKYIVVHYTGNDGDSDENNGKYFKNNVVEVSAHYFVDDDSVTQSVPDNYTAWHCGARKYVHKECRNANSLGVEICDDVKNGTIYPSPKTITNAVELVQSLMDKYGIPKENVIRHYDVSGKLCPAYWCGTSDKDALWKTAFWNKLKEPNTSKKPSTGYLVKINTTALNVRSGAGVNYMVTCTVKKGEVYTIVGERNGWGLLKAYAKNRNGWINLKYTKKL